MFKAAALAGIMAAREKHAFSITAKGHAYDAARADIMARAHAELAALEQEHGGQAYRNPDGKSTRGSIMDVLRFGEDEDHTRAARYHDYVRRQHEKGENAYNPFGGVFTPSRHEEGGKWHSIGKSVPKGKAEKK